MRALGFLLLLVGAVTFLLPQFGLSFKFMDVMGNQRDTFAAGLALVGLSLMLFGGRRR